MRFIRPRWSPESCSLAGRGRLPAGSGLRRRRRSAEVDPYASDRHHQEKARLLGTRVQRPPHHARSGPCQRTRQRAGPSAWAAGGDDAALQDRRIWGVVADVRAAAAIIFNPVTGQILYEENSQDKRSIASITKVMTALVFLEDNPDLNSDVTVERSDVFAASTTYLRANDHITDDQLLHLLLIASDNGAARALARTSHGGSAQFVERMNEKAIELGPGKHELRRSVRAESGQRVLGVRPVSSDYLRGERRAHLVDHAHADLHGDDQPPDDPDSQHESSADQRRCRRHGGKTGFIGKSGLLPGNACCASPGESRLRSWSSALTRIQADSGRRAISSIGSPRRPARCS